MNGQEIIDLKLNIFVLALMLAVSAFGQEDRLQALEALHGLELCGAPAGVINPGAGETCDGPNLAGLTCEDFNFEQGTLACNASCQFDISGCSNPPPPPTGVYDLLAQNLPPPGQWGLLPNSSVALVLTKDNEFPYCGASGIGIKCYNSYLAFQFWSGMTLDPATGGWYLLAAGGHSGYGGNEVYKYDLSTLNWSRITIPQPLTGPFMDPPDRCPSPASGPGATHLYGGTVWVPTKQEFLVWKPGGYCTAGGAQPESFGLWTFKPSTNAWTRLPFQYPADAWLFNSYYHRCAYDTERDRVYCIGGSNAAFFHELDPQNGYAPVGATNQQMPYGNTGMALFHPSIRRLYWSSEFHGLYKVDIDLNGVRTGAANVFDPWPDGFAGTTAIALHAPSGDLIAWHGDHRLLRIKTDGTQTEITPAVGYMPPAFDPAQGGRVYSKWIYIPEVDAFVGTAKGTDGVFVYRLPQQQASLLPSAEDERNTYRRWGWTWQPAQEPENITEPVANYSITNADVHGQTEGDDLWTYLQMYRRSGNLVYLNRANAWLRYFKDEYRQCSGATPNYSFCYDLRSYGADHVYGWGLILANEIPAAESIADTVEQYTFGPQAPFNCKPDGCIWNARLFGRQLLLFSELATSTSQPRWVAHRDRLISLFKSSSYWDEARGMVWASQYTTDFILGPGRYAAGDRIQSGFMVSVLAEGLWKAYLSTGDPVLRGRLVAMARYIDQYGLDPAAGYIGESFGWVGGAAWHKNPQTEYTTSQVNLLVMGYKLTGDVALLDRAKHFLNRGTKGITGHPEIPRTPDDVVDHFMDTKWDTSSGNVYLSRNKGELLYTYLIFENGGQPSVL